MPEVYPEIESLAYMTPELESYETRDGDLVVFESERPENWIKGSSVEARR